MASADEPAPDVGNGAGKGAGDATRASVQATLAEALRRYRANDFDAAAALCDAVLAQRPDNVHALQIKGGIAVARDEHEAALGWFDRAVALNQFDADILALRAASLLTLGREADAMADYRQARAIDPDNPRVPYNFARALIARRRYDAGLAALDRALAIRADYADALILRSNTLHTLGRFDAALASYDRAFAVEPDNPQLRYNFAHSLLQWRHFDKALDMLDAALALRPGYTQAHDLRGSTLRRLGRFDEALESYDRALALDPRFAQAHSNKGVTLHDLLRKDDALACLDTALEIDPDYAQARFNKAIVHLLNGEFAQGWPHYEARRTTGTARRFDVPQWQGDAPLDGSTLLLHAEQGFGDTIQFSRYARLAADRGARVVLEVPRTLAGLMRTLDGPDTVVARGDPLPAFDLHCPLMSLPFAIGTELATIPASERYLDSDPARRATWEGRLADTRRPRVGLAWSGNLDNVRDRKRSIPLATLLRHLPDGYEYVSLQKDVRDADAATLEQHTDIRHLGERLGDFADTAAVCDLCDAIVSVDTALAHLAGALGRPTLIPVSHVPDWRWLLNRDDSPWYPSVRLLRQPAWDDWDGALAGIAAELATLGR